jgi:hypothetical protein
MSTNGKRNDLVQYKIQYIRRHRTIGDELPSFRRLLCLTPELSAPQRSLCNLLKRIGIGAVNENAKEGDVGVLGVVGRYLWVSPRRGDGEGANG